MLCPNCDHTEMETTYNNEHEEESLFPYALDAFIKSLGNELTQFDLWEPEFNIDANQASIGISKKGKEKPVYVVIKGGETTLETEKMKGMNGYRARRRLRIDQKTLTKTVASLRSAMLAALQTRPEEKTP